MINPSRILRNRGFCFTWRSVGDGRVRVSLWRLDVTSGERHWVSCATAANDRDAIRARALALMAWAESVSTAPGRGVQAQAVAASIAMTAYRLGQLAVTMEGRHAAASAINGRRAA